MTCPMRLAGGSNLPDVTRATSLEGQAGDLREDYTVLCAEVSVRTWGSCTDPAQRAGQVGKNQEVRWPLIAGKQQLPLGVSWIKPPLKLVILPLHLEILDSGVINLDCISL